MNSTLQSQKLRRQINCTPTVGANGPIAVGFGGASLEARTHLATIQGALSLLRRGRFDLQSSQAQRLMEIATDSTNCLLHGKEGLSNQQQPSISRSEAPQAQLQLYGASNSKKRKKSIRIRRICKGYEQGQQLQASEARFRNIITNSADGIFIVDNQGLVKYANPAAASLFNTTADELLGKTLFGELVMEVDEEINTRPIYKVGQPDSGPARVVQTHVQLLRRDGRTAVAEMQVVETEWEGHVAVAYLVSLRDITDRLRAEEERDRFFTLSLDMLCIANFDGYFKRINPAWEKTLGYTKEELFAQPFIEFVHPDDRAATIAEIQKIIAGVETISFENRYRCQGGEYRWLLWSATSFPEEQLIYATARDITERKQVEVALRLSEAKERDRATQLSKTIGELKQTQGQLVQAEKMSSIGQLVAGVAHEINNPINFIHGNLDHVNQYTQDLLDLLELYQLQVSEPSPEIAALREAIDLEFLMADLPKVLDSMRMGTDRVREIVRSLRNFSRVDQAEVKAVDIHEGIDNTLLILQHRLKASGGKKQIQVVKEYGDLPPVECYSGQLNQVFMNILSNAIDALDSARDHQQQPSICIASEMLENNHVVIRIADNGSGIPPEILNRLFDPFFTTKPVGKGTGLGLSISYQIVVEKHGGLLKCQSEPGQGTEFWVEIPVRCSHVTRPN
ncbi:MAG: PAS domain S-box protein [Hormoscilla sp.]